MASWRSTFRRTRWPRCCSPSATDSSCTTRSTPTLSAGERSAKRWTQCSMGSRRSDGSRRFDEGVAVFRTILIATDGTEAGDAAVEYGRDLALEQRCRLRLVHVDELIHARGGVHHLHPLEPEIRAKIRGQVSDLMEDGLDADFEIRQVVAKSPAHAIAGAANAVDADLIVLGQIEDSVMS